MISHPPARQAPFTAAMIGLGKLRWVMPPNPPEPPMMAPPSPEAKALRSMPAEKGLSPAPVRTTTQHSSSASSSSSAAAIPLLTSPLMALRASGLLMVMISTCPRRSRSTAAMMLLLSVAPESDRPGHRTATPPRRSDGMSENQSIARWRPRHDDPVTDEIAPHEGGQLVRRRHDPTPVFELGDHRRRRGGAVGPGHDGRR